jgi:acetyl-CoA acetyltransferase
MDKVFVVGVGMTPFIKPGSREGWDFPDMVKDAVGDALADAGLVYEDVDQATVGYNFGDSCEGQRALYEVGMTGAPITNVNNNCASGSTALRTTTAFIAGGMSDCGLAVGFERMDDALVYSTRAYPIDRHVADMGARRGMGDVVITAQLFGNAGREHRERYGTTAEQFAKVAVKNHRHSVENPLSQYRDEYTLEEVLGSRMMWEPLTLLQCCPTSSGAAAAVLASERFVNEHGLEGQAVEIVAQAMATDVPFEGSDLTICGSEMTRAAAEKVYEQSGLGPEDVDVIELHDCFSTNELITYEGLGLCPPGEGGRLIDEGAVTYGGEWVVNPSGGLLSKGHPIGATGLAQCAELNWQLRGLAQGRQVEGAEVALQHNLGLGGAGVVTMYRAPAGAA